MNRPTTISVLEPENLDALETIIRNLSDGTVHLATTETETGFTVDLTIETPLRWLSDDEAVNIAAALLKGVALRKDLGGLS